MGQKFSIRRQHWHWNIFDTIEFEHSAAVIGGAAALLFAALAMLISLLGLLDDLGWLPWVLGYFGLLVVSMNSLAWGMERSSQRVEGTLQPVRRSKLSIFFEQRVTPHISSLCGVLLIGLGLTILSPIGPVPTSALVRAFGPYLSILGAAYFVAGVLLVALRRRIDADTAIAIALFVTVGVVRVVHAFSV